MKKIFKIIGFVLLFVVVIAIGIPYLFKGKMIALIKEKVNQNINAKVDFKDVYATLLNKWLGADDKKILNKQYDFLQFV
jgi:hypothetical protein